MAIDFNTPNPIVVDTSTGQSKKAFFLYLGASMLSISSLLLSVWSISKKYTPKPIVIECDPSVIQDIRTISEKMNQIELDKDKKP